MRNLSIAGSVRKADTADQMAQLVAASGGKRLMYRDLVA